MTVSTEDIHHASGPDVERMWNVGYTGGCQTESKMSQGPVTMKKRPKPSMIDSGIHSGTLSKSVRHGVRLWDSLPYEVHELVLQVVVLHGQTHLGQ